MILLLIYVASLLVVLVYNLYMADHPEQHQSVALRVAQTVIPFFNSLCASWIIFIYTLCLLGWVFGVKEPPEK